MVCAQHDHSGCFSPHRYIKSPLTTIEPTGSSRPGSAGGRDGTQAVTQLPRLLRFGNPNELTLALMMDAAWLVNLGVAEWLIRRERVAAKRAAATPAPPTTS